MGGNKPLTNTSHEKDIMIFGDIGGKSVTAARLTRARDASMCHMVGASPPPKQGAEEGLHPVSLHIRPAELEGSFWGEYGAPVYSTTDTWALLLTTINM